MQRCCEGVPVIISRDAKMLRSHSWERRRTSHDLLALQIQVRDGQLGHHQAPAAGIEVPDGTVTIAVAFRVVDVLVERPLEKHRQGDRVDLRLFAKLGWLRADENLPQMNTAWCLGNSSL